MQILVHGSGSAWSNRRAVMYRGNGAPLLDNYTFFVFFFSVRRKCTRRVGIPTFKGIIHTFGRGVGLWGGGGWGTGGGGVVGVMRKGVR